MDSNVRWFTPSPMATLYHIFPLNLHMHLLVSNPVGPPTYEVDYFTVVRWLAARVVKNTYRQLLIIWDNGGDECHR
jgi:hypothetical protein